MNGIGTMASNFEVLSLYEFAFEFQTFTFFSQTKFALGKNRISNYVCITIMLTYKIIKSKHTNQG